MPILGRDESSTLYKGSIDRIGVVPATMERTWRMRLSGHTEVLTLTTKSMAQNGWEGPASMDDVILAKPGDLVTLKITRQFGNLIVSDFVNDSLAD